MPIYEYRCNDCGSDFEYMQRMSEPAKSACESCGGALERLISRSSFHLKGGGWYKDLYSAPKPSSAPASSDSKADSGSSSGSGADSSSGSKKEPAQSSKAGSSSSTVSGAAS